MSFIDVITATRTERTTHAPHHHPSHRARPAHAPRPHRRSIGPQLLELIGWSLGVAFKLTSGDRPPTITSWNWPKKERDA